MVERAAFINVWGILNSETKEFRDADEVIYPGISEATAANNPLQNGSTTRARQDILNKVI
jgi:imidazoleglycerol phosphate synthase glutamine amidotransferase subunit HisH